MDAQNTKTTEDWKQEMNDLVHRVQDTWDDNEAIYKMRLGEFNQMLNHKDRIIKKIEKALNLAEQRHEKEITAIRWLCPVCKIQMQHQAEVHTFQCPKCGRREWYPQRGDDLKEARK